MTILSPGASPAPLRRAERLAAAAALAQGEHRATGRPGRPGVSPQPAPPGPPASRVPATLQAHRMQPRFRSTAEYVEAFPDRSKSWMFAPPRSGLPRPTSRAPASLPRPRQVPLRAAADHPPSSYLPTPPAKARASAAEEGVLEMAPPTPASLPDARRLTRTVPRQRRYRVTPLTTGPAPATAQGTTVAAAGPVHVGSQAALPSPALPSPAQARANDWWRLQALPRLRRALQVVMAVAKLGADAVDFLGAALATPLLGTAACRVVCSNFRDDWRLLVGGHDPAASRAALPSHPPGPGLAASQGMPGPSGLSGPMADVATLRREFKALQKAETERLLRRFSFTRSLGLGAAVAGLCLSGMVAATFPPLGIPATVVAVLSLRQAYANWRLARQNLANFQAGKSISPMNSSALGDRLMQQYLKDQAGVLQPEEARLQAVNAAARVTAASVLVGLAMTGASGDFVGPALLDAAPATAAYAARLTGSSLTPVLDAGTVRRHDAVAARLAQEKAGDLSWAERCAAAWSAFLLGDERLQTAYLQALERWNFAQVSSERHGRDPDIPPVRVDVAEALRNPAPLVEWTWRTRRFDELQQWLDRDRQSPPGPGQPTWADRLLMDLEGAVAASQQTVEFGAIGGLTQAAVLSAAIST